MLAQAGVSTPVRLPPSRCLPPSPTCRKRRSRIPDLRRGNQVFNITIKQVPASAFGQGRTDHTFQAFLLLDYSITLTPSYELNVYTAKNTDGFAAGNNLGAWVNPAFYAAKAEADALADPYTQAAGKLWNAAERIFIDQAPIAFIAQIQPTTAFRTDVSRGSPGARTSGSTGARYPRADEELTDT